jgi:hypothetical protein
MAAVVVESGVCVTCTTLDTPGWEWWRVGVPLYSLVVKMAAVVVESGVCVAYWNTQYNVEWDAVESSVCDAYWNTL